MLDCPTVTHYGLLLLIQKQMEARGITRNRLAEMVSPRVSRQTVYNLFMPEKTARIETLLAVFDALDMHIVARKPRQKREAE